MERGRGSVPVRGPGGQARAAPRQPSRRAPARCLRPLSAVAASAGAAVSVSATAAVPTRGSAVWGTPHSAVAGGFHSMGSGRRPGGRPEPGTIPSPRRDDHPNGSGRAGSAAARVAGVPVAGGRRQRAVVPPTTCSPPVHSLLVHRAPGLDRTGARPHPATAGRHSGEPQASSAPGAAAGRRARCSAPTAPSPTAPTPDRTARPTAPASRARDPAVGSSPGRLDRQKSRLQITRSSSIVAETTQVFDARNGRRDGRMHGPRASQHHGETRQQQDECGREGHQKFVRHPSSVPGGGGPTPPQAARRADVVSWTV